MPRLIPVVVTALLILLTALSSTPAGVHAADPPRIFPVRDYGALPDGKTECGGAIRQTVQAAIDSGSVAEVVLEAGTYRVQAGGPRGYCFPIHQAQNLVIRGAGKATKIVVTNPAAGTFSLALCRKITLRDLTIDYDPLPFCQGRIQAVDVAAGWFDLEIDAGYATPDADNFMKAQEPYGKWGMIIDPVTRRIRVGTPDHYMTPRWEHQEGRTWRFFTEQEHYRRGLQHMRVGDAYVHLARGFGGAVLAYGCEDLHIENVTVYASPGLAVGLVANRGEIMVHGLQVRFAPDSTRLLSTNADTPHGAALVVRAVRLGHGLAEAEAIRDIVIEDNEFIDRAGTAIFAGGATNVRLEKNRITAEVGSELRFSGGAILLECSSAVLIRENEVSDLRPGTKAALEIGATVAPSEAGVRIEDLRAALSPENTPIIDRRK